MTPRERAAYNAGIAQMRTMATIAAITLETEPDADDLRHRAAAAALHGLAEGPRALMPFKPDPIAVALRIITDETGSGGIITCPVCAGRFAWSRDPGNCHVHGYGPVMFDLPDIVTANDVRTATGAIVRAVTAGALTPDEAGAVAGVIELHRPSIETSDIAARLNAIEAQFQTTTGNANA